MEMRRSTNQESEGLVLYVVSRKKVWGKKRSTDNNDKKVDRLEAERLLSKDMVDDDPLTVKLCCTLLFEKCYCDVVQ